jgi:CheY-like chemotaxis protein
MNDDTLSFYSTLTILCVEDDEDILKIYKELFGLIFKKVYFAQDGKEGLELFKNEKIDIVLTDYYMPRLNGLDMSKEIRKLDESVPIILVTALENIEMLREAIDIHITSFLKKPFNDESLFNVFNLAVQSVLAQRMILQERLEKIIYNDYQEKLTFSKEKLITKNDLQGSKKLLDFRCEVVYKPKDTLSGDSYIIRKLGEDEYFVFLIDGMGKGISASVTAMMCSAYVNYLVDEYKRLKKNFSLEMALKKLHQFIAPNLLEDEIISMHALHFKKNDIAYAIFAMPPILCQNSKGELHKIKSNNPPYASYVETFNISHLHIEDVTKLMLYSDGVNENTLDGGVVYGDVLAEDFLQAQNTNQMEQLRMEKVKYQEDDVTYIFLQKMDS